MSRAACALCTDAFPTLDDAVCTQHRVCRSCVDRWHQAAAEEFSRELSPLPPPRRACPLCDAAQIYQGKPLLRDVQRDAARAKFRKIVPWAIGCLMLLIAFHWYRDFCRVAARSANLST